ncbi:MAG: zinc ABC transporter substrate-binding protein [Deltaproteobacteria bacterium]|nr:zinc ABC transporter substrate-binding protein [Deltaproteobacteria bacterium]
MNRMKPFLIVLALLLACLPARADGNKKTILCTTFPIFQITRNVVSGNSAVTVQLMLPAALGCPHDYALTPQDMQKIARADVLIVNGLGMEEYLGAPVKKANPDLKVVDSSAGIKEILRYAGQDDHEEADRQEHDHDQHGGVNPHLFTSPRLAGRLAMNIAAELAELDPAGAATFLANAKAYEEKMQKLADDFSALGKRLGNNRIVTQHGVFDYLARDMGLEVVAVVQAHAGQEPSAAEMLRIVKIIREKKAGGIFTEPQYPAKVGQTIARETGVAVATLDPGASGPENGPLDYYETVMRHNMLVLGKTLGAK